MYSTSRFSTVRIIAVSVILCTFVSAAFTYSGRIVRQAQRVANPVPSTRTARNNSAQSGATDRQTEISDAAKQQIAALINEKESRTPTEQKIDSQLLQAVRESRGQQMAAGVNLVRANVSADDTGRLAVDISASVTDGLLDRIRQLGGRIIYPSAQYKTIRAEINLTDTETIARYPEVIFIQPAVQAITLRSKNTLSERLDSSIDLRSTGSGPTARFRPSFAERAQNVRNQLLAYFANSPAARMFTGGVDSEGVRTHRVDDVRNTYGYAGEGVRIGVLSDSFAGSGNVPRLISGGELPGPGNPFGNLTPVTVLEDTHATDEGSDMLQIVHDIAPRAQLYFATANISEADFAANILALRSAPNNCDIIIDDIEYFDEPAFQDGIVAQAVNSVTAAGGLYFSSAGNAGSLAKNTSGVWEGDFTNVGSSLIIPGNFKSGSVLNFGTSGSPIQGNAITSLGGAYILSWSDPQGLSTNDYDLFLMDASLTTVKASSTNIQSGSQNPFERVTGSSVAIGDRLVVFKTNTAAARAIHLNTFGGTLSVGTTGQTHGHSAAIDAFSVAAAPASKANKTGSPTGPFPNAFSSSNQLENFSSDGPRRIFYNADGTAITPGNVLFNSNGGVVRNKPDITAADGVTIADDVFPLPVFFGTSAAAPNAGAIAAVLKSANPSLTPAQLRTILTSTALDVESQGFDNISGFGIIQAFQAMQAIQPSPVVHLNFSAVAATEGAFSNHNGVVDPGESANLVFTLTNPTQTPATNVQATIFGLGSAVKTSASFGTVAPLATVSNSDNPMVVSIPASFANSCGGQIRVFLLVTFDGDVSPQQFALTIPVTGKQTSTISGLLGRSRPTSPNFGSNTGTMNGVLSRDGVASSCSTASPAPTVVDPNSSHVEDSYSFVNNGPDQCVTVTMTSPNGSNLYTAAYGDNFNSGNLTQGLIGVAGSSSNNQTFSFMAKAGQRVIVVINAVPTSSSGLGLPYTLSTSLNNSLTVCEIPPSCNLTLSPPTIPSPTVGTPFSQTFTGTGGSGIYGFTTSIQVPFAHFPTGLTFSGNTMSGTPTEAGNFPITVGLNDLVCSGVSQDYIVKVLGNPPVSIVATAGNGQSAAPGTNFSIPLKATVRDALNRPLPGVSVSFSVDNTLGQFASFNGATTSLLTDANGEVTAPPLTALTATGSFSVNARMNGFDPVRFILFNSCPTAIVTSTNDSGPGTLRDAVQNVCNNGVITFGPQVTGTISLTSGEIVVNKNLAIQGPGANVLAISGGHKSRILTVAQFGFLSLSGLTIRDGAPSATDTVGGGGGMLFLGNGSITDSIVSDNDSSNTASGSGGGIEAANGGGVSVTRSAIIHNIASVKGGGIHIVKSGGLTVTDSTIAENTSGNTGEGGGIEDDAIFGFQITNSTIFGNSANIGGNISNHSGSVTLKNSIIAGGVLLGSSPTSPDVNNVQFFTTNGDFNLIQDATGATFIGTPHNITGVSPLLLPLGNYGGPTPTMLPQPNSPVINAGSAAVVADLDQRGLFCRPTGNTDLGAVGTSYALSVTNGTSQSTKVNSPFSSALQATVTESGLNFPNATVTFTTPTSGASALFGGLNTATGFTNANGVATAQPLIANGIVGSYQVTASIGSSILPVKYNLTNLPAAASISIISGSPQNAPPGTTYQTAMKVVVKDTNNNLLPGISVTFSAPQSGASGTFAGGTSSTIAVTDAGGVATAPAFTANAISGTYFVTANVEGNLPPAQFSLRNVLPGPPSGISASAGTPQTVTIGCDFLTTLRATVLDASSVPVGGITVMFTVNPNGNSSATFAGGAIVGTGITDNNGNANAPNLTANEFAGDYTVTASISEVPDTVTYNLTNRIKFGDLTGEGTVNVQDLLVMANILAGNIHPTTGRKMMADVFQDAGHQVNIQDLFTLANFLAGNITTLPVIPTAQNAKMTPDVIARLNEFSSDWSDILKASELPKIDGKLAGAQNSFDLNRPETPFTIFDSHWQSPEFWFEPLNQSYKKTVYRLRGT